MSSSIQVEELVEALLVEAHPVEVPQVVDLLGLLESFPSFHLISCSKEMLLPDPREKPEEMQSMKDPDLRRTVMLTSSPSTRTSTT